MEAQYQKYRTCPGCGKDISVHDTEGVIEKAKENFRNHIGLNRRLPKEEFKKWLVDQRNVFINGGTTFNKRRYEGLQQMILYCRPEDFHQINHNGIRLMAILFEWVDIVDEELRKLDNVIVATGDCLIKESIIARLYEEFSEDYFPNEDKMTWRMRWMDGNQTLPPIAYTNKIFLLLLLSEVQPLLKNKIQDINMYAKKAWGLNSYSVDASRHMRPVIGKWRPQQTNIQKILIDA